MRLFIFNNASLVGDQRFAEEPVLVGSGEDCRLRLPDAGVAGHQAWLRPTAPGRWSVQPVEGEAVQVNGVRITAERELRDLDEVVFGPFMLKIYLVVDGRDVGPESRSAARAAPRERIAPLPGALIQQQQEPLVLSPLRLFEHADFAGELGLACDTAAIMERVLARARAAFEADAVCMRVRQRSDAGLEIIRATDRAGRPIEPPPTAAMLHERCMHPPLRICLPGLPPPATGSAMAAPIVATKDSVLGLLYAESATPQKYDGRSLDALTALAAAVAPPLERAVRGAAQQRAEDTQREQLLSRQVQDTLTLQAMPNWPELQFAAYRRPGAARCCDHYDLLRLANRTVALLAARVDAPAADYPRLVSELHAAFRAGCLHTDPPHVFARTLNWLTCDGRGEYAVSLACAWIAPDDGQVKYCLAGDRVTAGVISGGDWRGWTPDGAPPAGRARGFAYQSRTDELSSGDVVTVVTGGADALRNAAGDAFGRMRTIESLSDLSGTAVNVMLGDVVQELDEFTAGGVCRDDLSILLAKRM